MTTDMGGGGGGANGDLRDVRVFISYPRGGRTHSIAQRLNKELTELGAKPFLDESSLLPGSSRLSHQIEQGIAQAQVLLFLLGADTRKCDWQEREARYAQDCHVPVVVAQTSPDVLPVYVGDAVPVAAAGPISQWLPKLIEALVREALPLAPRKLSEGMNDELLAAQLDAELLRYLDDRLAKEFSDRVERYVPLAGQRRESRLPQKGHKGLRFAPRMDYRTQVEGGGYGEPVPHGDVLDVYSKLPADRQPRLAVLGDPGAGKSFSLERLFCALAEAVLQNPNDRTLPAPLLLRLGDWTRAGERLDEFLCDQLREADCHMLVDHWSDKRRRRPLVLLLDAYNEIPVGQRLHKATQVQIIAGDTRWAAVIVSCRERDFTQELTLPFDTLTLQALTPMQVLEYLERWERIDHDPATSKARAESQFLRLVAGREVDAARSLWRKWESTGTNFADFWTSGEAPLRIADDELRIWQRFRHNPRSLLRLAGSPFWLSMLVERGLIDRAESSNRLALVDEFLGSAHADGERVCEKRQALSEVPELQDWVDALQALAIALQHSAAARQTDRTDTDTTDGGAQTRLPRDKALAYLPGAMLEFSISVQVLRESGGQVHFHHQLLQEALAARAMLAAVENSPLDAQSFWPARQWWRRNGWEVVAELAAEHLGDDVHAVLRLIAWLTEAQPEVALQVWRSLGEPPLPDPMRERIHLKWLCGMTNPTGCPHPEARAAFGRALAGFDLDDRTGVGVDVHDGLPDIDWVEFDDRQPFIYQDAQLAGLEPFALSRYLVTHRQFQAFADALDGYANQEWWQGFEREQLQTPRPASWPEANSPRESVNWFEAVAFCRWLTVKLHRTGRLRMDQAIWLPTERQWERAARGREGRRYPNSPEDYVPGSANCDESEHDRGGGLQRTSAVGLFPHGASREGCLLDMVGNVWEWCANALDPSEVLRGIGASDKRVLRGGCWANSPELLRASSSTVAFPSYRSDTIGFRLCRASAPESLPIGAAGR